VIDPTARGAWRDLEDRIRPFVARRVRSAADVDDVVQEVFVRIQRGLPSLRDEERFGPWVYRLARNAIVDHRRSAARNPLADSDPPEPVSGSPDDEDDGAVARQLAGYVAPFVAALPSPYREALTLTELEGLTQKEAAEMLGISVSGMKSRVQRGRQQLRGMLEDCCRIALDRRGRVVACEPRDDGRLPPVLESTRFVVTPCGQGDCLARAPARAATEWKRAEVSDTERWVYRVDEAERGDIRAIVGALRGRDPSSLERSDLPPAGPMAEAAKRWRVALRDGLGFVLVRGLDVDGASEAELERTFAVLGLHLGSFVPQNLKGELLTHVRDAGADPTLPSTRLYTTRAEQDFHTDGADVIGLLCVRTARVGGASRIASSAAIVAEIRRTRPDLYPLLFEDFPWHYQEEGREAFWFKRPICTRPAGPEGPLNTFFIPWYIRRSQELPDAPRLSAGQSEALAIIERLANDPCFHIDMNFQPGDVQWLKNAAILHKRTAYEDHDDPEQRRHLLRLWLSAPDFVDGDAQLRAGVTEENGS
jgi:RNA polymerase sigma-70 factor (ECF subfamily)